MHARVEERYMPHTNSVASKISRIDIVDGTCAIIADDVPIANLGTSMAGEGGEGERQRGATSTSSPLIVKDIKQTGLVRNSSQKTINDC